MKQTSKILGLAFLVLVGPTVWRAEAAMTSVLFLETMASTAVKPWTGSGCNYPWTVTFNANNPFEQNPNANYGSGNANGLSFKNGTTNLADSTITTVQPIDARGNSATLTFCIQINIVSSNAGWAMQLNPGTGFTTRLSGQTSTSQNWQLYTYNLQPGDLVSNLALRFEFSEGTTANRIFLDQIALTTITGTTNAIIPFTAQYVRLPGGNYLMGDQFGSIDPKHYTDEVPVHNVYISPLYMDTTLVTCREYCDFLNAALVEGLIEIRTNIVYAVGGTNEFFYTHDISYSSRIQYQNGMFVVLESHDLHPVTSVNWFGAIAYCNWLSQSDGFDSCYNLTNGDVDFTKNGWRLPTEAEWEYAAHGGLTNPYSMFPWGTNVNADGTYANWENSGDPFESTNDYPCTTPVGFYNGALRLQSDYNWPGSQTRYQTSDGSNPYGLYDMGGNVWEWCNDWYMNGYYAYCTNHNIVTNPPGPSLTNLGANDCFPDSATGQPYRCLRGGTWWNGNAANDFDYGHARVSNRDPAYFLGGGPPGDPYGQWSQTGFRVMRREMIPQTVGLFISLPDACSGYTLMSPMQGTDTYLLNNAGQYVHKWTSRFNPGRADYLLENGHLMRACAIPKTVISTGGGEGGRLEEHDWLGNLVWTFSLDTATNLTHHDFKVLPNGNVLMIASELKTYAEVLAAGFNPSMLRSEITTTGGFMLPDYIIEVQPVAKDGTTNGIIVWEWHTWDHLIQDFDSSKNNYGVVSNHVELVNVNPSGGQVHQFWNHMNGIDYNPQLDQIVLSVRGNSELWVIDHQLTTAQAAGHVGGRYGKGGDLLYRWGNPQQYNLGAGADEKLFQQHCVTWIPTNCPGAGHFLIHNNGIGRNYTSIDEIIPPVDANGNYYRASGAAFGPAGLCWTYTNNPATNFFSAEISGAERLPNGNTLITWGTRGILFEVTSNLQTVWQYVDPVTHAPLAQGSTIPFDPNSNPNFPPQTLNEVFKVHRYPTNFPGFAGKDLTPRGTVETYTGAATDTVGLGMPDLWVRSHFGSLSAVTATSSHSGNDLTDLQEYQYGLDPTVWSSANNGIPDGWAIAFGLDPTLAATASMLNSNGNTSLQNYIADLNPTNSASRFAIAGSSIRFSGATLFFASSSNRLYTLYYTTNLVSGVWTNLSLQTDIPGTGGITSLTDPAPSTTPRFYRVGVRVP